MMPKPQCQNKNHIQKFPNLFLKFHLGAVPTSPYFSCTLSSPSPLWTRCSTWQTSELAEKLTAKDPSLTPPPHDRLLSDKANYTVRHLVAMITYHCFPPQEQKSSDLLEPGHIDTRTRYKGQLTSWRFTSYFSFCFIRTSLYLPGSNIPVSESWFEFLPILHQIIHIIRLFMLLVLD